jgi:hypothetical protein
MPLLIDAFMIPSRDSVMYEAHFFKTQEGITSNPLDFLFSRP